MVQAILRKNTKRIRKKLEDYGYIFNSNNADEFITRREEYPFIGINIYSDKTYSGLFENINDFYIDCGTNEELFFAIAALRDDTWLNQWIVVPKIEIRRLSGYFGQTCGMDGHYINVIGYNWTICNEQNLHNKVQSYIDDGEDPKSLPHKASIDELIEHFKK